MLKTLVIKNIAIIKELEISLENGLTVLSGETGAGKSIIVDSLNFLLGAKTDKTLLKSGEKEACVEGVFYINDVTKEQLKSLGLEADDDTLLLSRTLNAEGKTECRVNGRLITLSMLRIITDSMVDIHGQHEHQSLLKSSSHIKLLDAYTKDIEPLKAEVADIYHQYKKCLSDLSSFGMTQAERERMLDLLSYQIKEIKDAGLKKDEEEELLAERAKIVNFEKITRALSQAFEFLDGSSGADSSISQSLNALSTITKFDSEYELVFNRLESVKYEMDDIILTLKEKASDLDFDEKIADKIEARLELIKNLKRKYGADFDEINKFLERAQKDFDRLNSS
ncbi:MAG TPA: AAA family ATPase, partial [Clostridia bacterium]